MFRGFLCILTITDKSFVDHEISRTVRLSFHSVRTMNYFISMSRDLYWNTSWKTDIPSKTEWHKFIKFLCTKNKSHFNVQGPSVIYEAWKVLHLVGWLIYCTNFVFDKFLYFSFTLIFGFVLLGHFLFLFINSCLT